MGGGGILYLDLAPACPSHSAWPPSLLNSTKNFVQPTAKICSRDLIIMHGLRLAKKVSSTNLKIIQETYNYNAC